MPDTGLGRCRVLAGDLGRVGVWTFAFDAQPAGLVREGAAEIEELGYGALWFGEAYGRDAAGQASLLLAATRRLVVATGIASVERRDPVSMAMVERTLGEAFPGRFLLGIGGHRTASQPGAEPAYRSGRSGPTGAPRAGALGMMRDYLDAMDAAARLPGVPAVPESVPRRVLAALGPKMLQLAAERTWGAHSYFVPVAHTARARAALGPHAFLGVEQAVVLDRNLDRAREVAAAHVAGYMAMAHHQIANVRRLGFGDEDFVDGRPSRRLVDAIVAYGDVDALHARVREHLDAGADHVCVQVLTADPGVLPRAEWRELAPALVG
ncbi:TIGR03620 family F420-dependent LLM class oxidoreductase [Streptomyces sp. NPDC059009]|uniref:TIGR03620 family F420-dependent LLM class oxidoreductase n=1 Tax=Streptomyces sp. NPDC059009 TaxID=3346694 RepID=UPI0036AA30B9